MKQNIIKICLLIPLFIGNQTLFCQLRDFENESFCRNDAVQFYHDTQSNLINLKKDTNYINSYDIVISSQGINNTITHIEIKDSCVYIFDYNVKSAGLSLISKKTIYSKNYLYIENIQGYYQYYCKKNIHNSYFKEITIYKDREIVSKFLFCDVKKSNFELPQYKEIDPLIKFFHEFL